MIHCNVTGNTVTLTKFGALDDVKMTSSCAANEENFAKIIYRCIFFIISGVASYQNFVKITFAFQDSEVLALRINSIVP